MTTIQNIVLIGASGILGRAVLQALQASNSFNITILSRPESTATFPPSIPIIKTTYSLSNLTTVFQNQHAVINTSSLKAIPLQRTIIDACITANVHRYITNDFGNAHSFTGLPELEPTRAAKLDILSYAQSQATTHPSFTWSALATGHFLDYAIRKFPQAMGFDLAARTARIVDDGVEPFSATTLPDIGAAVVGILTRSEQTKNRYLLVRTLETTQREILGALEDQTGVTWDVEVVDSGELYERGKRKLKNGEPGAMLDLLPVQIFTKGAGRYAFPREMYDNELLGVVERSVDEVVRDVLAGV